MKRSFWLVSLLLAVLMVFVGCHETEPTPPDDTAEPVLPLTLFADGKTSFTIVRGDQAGSTVVNAAVELRKAFQDGAGVNFNLRDEYEYQENGAGAKIAVGAVSDEVAQRLLADLRYDDYLVHAENGNLYLLGGSDEATAKAVSYFVKSVLGDKTGTMTLEGDTDLRYTHKYAVRNLTIAGESITAYRIVYDADLQFSRLRAEELRDLIIEQSGAVLEVVPDTTEAVEHEILVGVTGRAESGAAAAQFAAPNLYWSVTVSGKRLLLVNQGVRSGEAMLKAVTTQFGKLTEDACDINATSFTLSGDVKSMLDKQAFARQEGTDLRVMSSNVLRAVYEGEYETDYTDAQRAEFLADTYLCYYPDVLLLEEMINGAPLPPVLRRLLSEWYEFPEADYLALFPDPASGEGQHWANLKDRKYATPVAYRKDVGLKHLESGFTYLSNMISYHGMSWSVLETADGNRFLAASVHLSENKTGGKWMDTYMRDVMKAINVARNKYGDLPIVMGGDFYFWQSVLPYTYTVGQGFSDVSECALKKFSVAIGTFHTLGKGEQDRSEEDLIFINETWFEALSHKNIIDFYTVNGSDHYPVMTDLRFRKSATEDSIPEFDDGTGNIDIRDDGPGGNGSWDDGVKTEN